MGDYGGWDILVEGYCVTSILCRIFSPIAIMCASTHSLYVLLYFLFILIYTTESLQKTESLVTQDDGTKKWKNNCWMIREDYFECLHAKKEWAMVRRVNEEEKRQAALAAGGQ